MPGAERKQAYFVKLGKLLEEHNKVLIVGADNVGSNQMMKVRKSLRGKATLLMGKNTMVRKAIRGVAESNPKLQALLPHIKNNVGLVFVKDDLAGAKKIITDNKVSAPAKIGAIAPCDVTCPAGPTGLDPAQTSFFQALNIATKISKGQVEISNDVKIITTGQKVGSSEAALLAKLNIKPFAYGLSILTVYDEGSIYEAKVLDMSDADIFAKFQAGLRNVAALSLGAGYPTLASVPHNIINGYKNVLAIGLGTDYSFAQVEKVKHAIANPTASAPAVTTTTAKPAETKKEEAKPTKKEEPEEDEDMGLGLFD